MTDREVKATIGVEIDAESFVRLKADLDKQFKQVKTAMAAAMRKAGDADIMDDKHLKQYTREFIAAKEKETAAVSKESKRQAKIEADASAARVKEERRANDLIEQQTKDHVKRIENIRHMKDRIREQGAGLFGGYRAMRGMRMFDEAKDLSKAQGGDGGNMAAIGLIAQVNAPLAALALAGKVLTAVFEDIRQAGKEASTALFQVGGGKSLQQLIVDTIKQQTLAAGIAGQSNITPQSAQDKINYIRSNYGINQENAGQLLGAYSTGSGGNLKNMPTDTLSRLSMLKDVGPEKAGSFMGRLKHVNPNATEGQLSDLAIAMWNAQNSSGLDLMSNETQIDSLRKHGPGLVGNVNLMDALGRGGGFKMKKSMIKELDKYETTNNGIDNLAGQMLNKGASTDTVPGALRAAAIEDNVKDTQKGMQEWLDSTLQGAGGLDKFNKAVTDMAGSPELVQIRIQNQLQIASMNTLKEATDTLRETINKNAKEVGIVTAEEQVIGLLLQRWEEEIKGGLAKTAVNIAHPEDARKVFAGEKAQEVLNNGTGLFGMKLTPEKIDELKRQVQEGIDAKRDMLGQFADINTSPTAPAPTKASGEKPVDTNQHIKAVAAQTKRANEIGDAANTYLKIISAHVSRIGPNPTPQHSPGTK
jgi:hypothetical protein